MRHRVPTTLVAIAAVGLLAGCGGASHGATPAAAGSHAPAASQSGVPSTAASTPASSRPPAATGSAQPSTVASAGAATPTPSASHDWTATAAELPITASVSPSCVQPGTVATLHVQTVPKAAIAFVAVYNGNKSGAAPPWGEGYGGNDKGTANADGAWSNSWTVTVNAPQGPAHVILAVGSKGKQRQMNVPFSVAKVTGGCG